MQGLIFDFVNIAWNWNCQIRLSLRNFKASVSVIKCSHLCFVRSTKRCNGKCFLEFQKDCQTGREVESHQIKLCDELTMCFTISISKIGPQFFSSFITIILTMTLWRSELNIFIPGCPRREGDPNLVFAVWPTGLTIRGSLRVHGPTFGSRLELLLPARAESAGSGRYSQPSTVSRNLFDATLVFIF